MEDELPPDPELINCQHCGLKLGEVVAIDGKYRFKTGPSMFAYSWHGWHECLDGELRQFHWDSGEVKLSRLLKRMKSNRVDIVPE